MGGTAKRGQAELGVVGAVQQQGARQVEGMVMVAAIQVTEAKLERAAVGMADFTRFVAEITDRDVLSRLGPRGMMAVTLPLLALAQTLLPRWGLLGGATLPLLWCAVAYYMLRFRLVVSLEAAIAGALLAWLASRTSFWSAGMLLLAVAAVCGVLRRWLYAEFWPAYAFAATLMTVCIPALALATGLPNSMHGVREFLGTLVLAPVTGAAMFVGLEWVRARLGIRMEFPQDDEQQYDPSYVYPPFAARGSGI
jgi:hypothetical protein